MVEKKFFTEKLLKKHIRDHGVWRKEYNYRKKNLWAHVDRDPNRNKKAKTAYDAKLKAFYAAIKNYKPSEETKAILERGFRVRLKILRDVQSYVNDVRKEENKKDIEDTKRKYEGFAAVRTLRWIYSDSDTESDEEEVTNLLKF